MPFPRSAFDTRLGFGRDLNLWRPPRDVDRYLAHLQGRMHEVSTLVLGPSGTGKELVASALGHSSFIPFDPKKQQFKADFRTAFRPIHLAAMSKTLIESELFGHKKGAFTGALSDRMGHLEGLSPWDVVFLDEIGELDGDIQVKLLRLLQAREFHRLGDTAPRRFGGKVIAATNRNLAHEIAQGSFREDLYYRLCADMIETPSLHEQLRDTPDELPHLVAAVLGRLLGSQDEATVEAIVAGVTASVGKGYRWPGNMRELEQCVRNLLVHNRYMPSSDGPDHALERLFKEMERLEVDLDRVIAVYLTWAYHQTGSYSEAGERVGVDRRTVTKHLDQVLLRRFQGVARALQNTADGDH